MNKKIVRKSGNLVKRKSVVRGKKIILRPKQAQIRQDLGNGFTRLVFTGFTINSGAFRTITFQGTQRNVYPVSGGWYFQYDQLYPAYAVSNYPQNDRDWVIVLYNPSQFSRTFQVFFIVKNP